MSYCREIISNMLSRQTKNTACDLVNYAQQSQQHHT